MDGTGERCQACRTLLSEGLNLCVRARDMEAMDRRLVALSISKEPEEWLASGRFDEHVRRNNIVDPDRPIHTRSATVPLWLERQYETDLAEWERKARHHLMQGCA